MDSQRSSGQPRKDPDTGKERDVTPTKRRPAPFNPARGTVGNGFEKNPAHRLLSF